MSKRMRRISDSTALAMCSMKRRTIPLILIARALSMLFIVLGPRLIEAADWEVGDVFLGISGGQYQVRAPDGTLKETISDGLGGFTAGCAFNTAQDRLYTTNFSNTQVIVYDRAHPHEILQVIDTNATSPNGQSESIVFDGAGNFYVGHPDGNDLIHQYDRDGTLLMTFSAAVDERGTDWIELASDQTTLFYTSEGRAVQRFDVGTNTQLENFAVLPGPGDAFALRLLPPGDGSGGLLVADNNDIKRLDGAGNVIQTYDVADEDTWFSLNLDPDNETFWSGNSESGNYYRFNLNTGAVVAGPFNPGTGSGTLFGICVLGEPRVLELNPLEAMNPTGATHTVTATVNPVVASIEVTFTVISGPNAGDTGTGITDTAGMASFTYIGDGGEGIDVIEAELTFPSGIVIRSPQVTAEWIETDLTDNCMVNGILGLCMGTDGDDVIVGTGGNDVIRGGMGNDIINSGAGDDTVFGEDGDDTITTGRGQDLVFGGLGQDIINAGLGDDIVFGEDGDDVIQGSRGSDFLDGGAGNDTIYSGRAAATTSATVGRRCRIRPTPPTQASPIIFGGVGEDTLCGDSGIDRILGGGDDDFIRGFGAGDRLFGEEGNDNIGGGRGNDFCRGAPGGDDRIRCERIRR